MNRATLEKLRRSKQPGAADVYKDALRDMGYQEGATVRFLTSIDADNSSVYFTRDFDVYGWTLVKAGDKGYVVEADSEYLYVELEKYHDELEQWDNIIQLDARDNRLRKVTVGKGQTGVILRMNRQDGIVVKLERVSAVQPSVVSTRQPLETLEVIGTRRNGKKRRRRR